MKNMDYRSLFIVGVVLFPVGIVTGLFPLFVLGMILVLISLGNRDKWEKA
jgi:hypothetical protein